jgi:hypothetical protein
MDLIRNFFRGLGCLWLVAIVTIGVGGTMLQRNPEQVVAVAAGAMSVESDASIHEKARQAAEGYHDTRAMLDSTGRRRQAESGSVASEWETARREQETEDAVRAARGY